MIRSMLFAVVSALISMGLGELVMRILSEGMNAAGFAASAILPLAIGGPFITYHMIRLEQLRLANQRLQVLASTDWLTGCLNRRAFTHGVTDQLRTTPEGAFLVIDADHFKVINDLHGHDNGDDVLRLMAGVIRASLREGDLVGRIGGEEFGIFLPGADLRVAEVFGERIRHAVERAHFRPGDVDHPLTVSVGAAAYAGVITFSALFRDADKHLYEAKQSGRNRVVSGAATAAPLPSPAPADRVAA